MTGSTPRREPPPRLTAAGPARGRLAGVGVPALARPLSEVMSGLLRDGDVHGRYASRSEAVLATALAAAGAGWTQAEWRDVLAGSALGDWAQVQHRKGGGRRSRNPPDSDRRLATTWAKAARRVLERPPAGDAPAVRAELAELVAAADADPGRWRGAAGVTDRAVLAALVDIAVRACTLTPSVSTRQLSETANISPGTAAVSLHRLAAAGWVARERPAAGTLAAVWRLQRPAVVREPPAGVAEVLDALPARPLLPPGGSARGHDVFVHGIHGGLGRVAARLFDHLDDGTGGGLDVRQLAALTGLHPRTVGRHLVGLQAAGLATAGGGRDGRCWARSLTAGNPDQLPAALDDAAVLLGCAGVTGRRRDRHLAQRTAYGSYWTDFTARAGWAVQRGLYRPDQPRLPLPQAA